ncbi:hypothetical protein MASSI9I_60404 [Massilia sp. 9I]|nr:hypothetical protein MASSI9I_60404 [Massilia sp. 9I]
MYLRWMGYPYRGNTVIGMVNTRTPTLLQRRDMVRGFDMVRLGVAPSLRSRHTVGCGIDMSINWSGDLLIRDAYGELIDIDRLPRTGMNRELHRVGASYGVIKYNRNGRDDAHWSDTGA